MTEWFNAKKGLERFPCDRIGVARRYSLLNSKYTKCLKFSYYEEFKGDYKSFVLCVDMHPYHSKPVISSYLPMDENVLKTRIDFIENHFNFDFKKFIEEKYNNDSFQFEPID